jgi:hypothetical protein
VTAVRAGEPRQLSSGFLSGTESLSGLLVRNEGKISAAPSPSGIVGGRPTKLEFQHDEPIERRTRNDDVLAHRVKRGSTQSRLIAG